MGDSSVVSAAESIRTYGCLATLTPNYATSIHTAQAFSTHMLIARATLTPTQRHHSAAQRFDGGRQVQADTAAWPQPTVTALLA